MRPGALVLLALLAARPVVAEGAQGVSSRRGDESCHVEKKTWTWQGWSFEECCARPDHPVSCAQVLERDGEWWSKALAKVAPYAFVAAALLAFRQFGRSSFERRGRHGR